MRRRVLSAALLLTVAALMALAGASGASARTSRVACANLDGDLAFRIKPALCGFTESMGPAITIYFDRMKWSNWGSARATGSGYGAFHGSYPPERLTLSRRHSCPGGYRYAVLSYHEPGSTDTSIVNLTTCGSEGL